MNQSHRIGNAGPFAFIASTVGFSRWVPLGPCLANKVSATLTCGTGTATMQLQGYVSTASTAAVANVLVVTSTQKSTIQTSALATPIGFLRARCVAIQAGNTVRLAVVVVP